MNPFYFGSRRRRLFGIYHLPTSRPIRRSGVVIAPPAGLEYMRSYRSLRRLAVHLAGAGYHVLRFDYHGTGDSGGEGTNETMKSWQDDLRTAAQELREVSGVPRITLLGVRLGGAIAMEAASDGVPSLDEVVLWDPVVWGTRYLDWLETRSAPDSDAAFGIARRSTAGDSAESMSGRMDEREDEGKGGAAVMDEPAIGIDGFPVGMRLLCDIGGVDLTRAPLQQLPARRVVLVTGPDTEAASLVQHLKWAGTPHAHRSLASAVGWEDPDRQGSMLLAGEAVNTIVDVLTTDGTEET